MDYEFELLRQTRKLAFQLAESLSDEQMMAIPPGFSNNLMWNMGHMVVSQQLLCYGLSGLPMKVGDKAIAMLRKGSSPAQWTEKLPFREIKAQMLPSVEALIADYEAGRFVNFQEYETSYGVMLNAIEDAIQFNNLHEGMHLGYILALRHAVLQK